MQSPPRVTAHLAAASAMPPALLLLLLIAVSSAQEWASNAWRLGSGASKTACMRSKVSSDTRASPGLSALRCLATSRGQVT